jgi:hypothetical protein
MTRATKLADRKAQSIVASVGEALKFKDMIPPKELP